VKGAHTAIFGLAGDVDLTGLRGDVDAEGKRPGEFALGSLDLNDPVRA
jgi:hypothetical protein